MGVLRMLQQQSGRKLLREYVSPQTVAKLLRQSKDEFTPLR